MGKIIEVKDNLLNFTNWNVIVHCCNAQGVMGSGIAKSIRDEFPAAYEEYMRVYRLQGNKLFLGSFTSVVTGTNKRIINLVAQEFYNQSGGEVKRHVDYEALYVGFEEIRYVLEEAFKQGRKYTLGIPYKMASDRAGGSWKIVLTMIEEVFKDSLIDIYIVRLNENKSVHSKKD